MAYMNTSGQSSTGVSTYNDLNDKPTINGHTLSGNLTLAQIGAVSSQDIATIQQDAASAKSDVALLQSRVNTALQQSTADALYLGKTAQAADSAKLGGVAPSGYATAAQGVLAGTAYQKPASGIPKTDLDSAAQSSLGKADSALQSVPNTNPRTVNGYLELYVSATGNDTTGDGSSTKPFKTIAKVAGYYNSLVGVSYVRIWIRPGTYALDAAQEVRFNITGRLDVYSETGIAADVKITDSGYSWAFFGGSVDFTGITRIVSAGGTAFQILCNLLATNGVVIEGGLNGFRLSRAGGGLVSNATINNCENAIVSQGTALMVAFITGTGNAVAFRADGGIMCLIDDVGAITASARILEANGGRVFEGGSV